MQHGLGDKYEYRILLAKKKSLGILEGDGRIILKLILEI
jgi:hypothetical protein